MKILSCTGNPNPNQPHQGRLVGGALPHLQQQQQQQQQPQQQFVGVNVMQNPGAYGGQFVAAGGHMPIVYAPHMTMAHSSNDGHAGATTATFIPSSAPMATSTYSSNDLGGDMVGQQRRAGLPACGIPLPTSHVKLPHPLRVNDKQTVDTLYHQFFKQYPEMWDKYNEDYHGNIKDIFKHYLMWVTMVRKSNKAAQAAAAKQQQKRPLDIEPVKESLETKAKRRIEEARNSLRQDLPAIHEPKGDDEKRFLPSSRAAHLVEGCCGQDVKLAASADIALELLTKSFVEEIVSFSVAMARRRGSANSEGQKKHASSELLCRDASLFLRTAWNIIVPSAGGIVRGYRCTVPKPSHKALVAAARKENFAEGKTLASGKQHE